MHELTRDVVALGTMVAREADLNEVLEQALAALREVVPYDLAAVFRLDDQRLRVVAASGPLDGPAVRAHSLELARFPTIRRALETRRPIPLEAHDHAGEGDPYDGVLDLPEGHSCMVVPLYAGQDSLGLITLDRQQCAVYPAEAVRMAGLVGQLVSVAIRFADQASELDRFRQQLQHENRRLRTAAGGGAEACRRLEASSSSAMQELIRLARQVARSELPVLIEGETGSGKEVLAQALHHWSARAESPLVTLNCAALPENLVESELFGHAKGAFTGALRDRLGAFRSAHRGTLLLDEVGELPLAAQAKLLRVLQEGVVQPVGSDRSQRVDVRVVAATHVELQRAVAEGRFREDLYYRLAVFPLRMPPLRERPEDTLSIARSLLGTWARDRRRGPWELGESARSALVTGAWPGNVRELRNVLERATLLQPRGELRAEHLGLARGRVQPVPVVAGLPGFEAHERDYLKRLLEASGGKLYGPDGAAALAGLKPSTLRSKLVKHGLR
jgi:transcriptional regulator with GAF, ATPase, and Fis domain